MCACAMGGLKVVRPGPHLQATLEHILHALEGVVLDHETAGQRRLAPAGHLRSTAAAVPGSLSPLAK